MTELQHNSDEICRLLWAMREDELAPEDAERLRSMLLEDPHARELYVYYMFLSGSLEWDSSARAKGRETGDGRRGMVGLPAIDLPVGAAVELPLPPDLESQIPEPRTPNPEPPFPTLSTTHYPLPTSHFSVGSWAFSYMVATVIMGVAILGLWAYKITHHQHIAEAPSKSAPSGARPEMVFVGRITGAVGVKWSDDPNYLPPLGFGAVPLGRKYILDSGLMEITYDSGAKVILEGPCTYKVESTAGGYLALGKLTARVEKKRSEVRGQKSDPSPLSPLPSPLFSVRTPTAVITDLGTEFGVEVSDEGTTESHVFQGKVEVRLTDGGVEARAIQLGANESARVEPGTDRIVVVSRAAVQPNTFTRQMPQWTPIKVFNTGIGLKEGDEDPHWQLVARGDDPDFQPRQAVVTTAHVNWQSNYAARSQWISTANGPPDVPNVTYTFRTTFELANALLETAVLRGRFLVDNHVQAIRLNGKEVPASEHGYDQLSWFSEISEFSASKGFVEGANTLEIDVLNGRPSEAGDNGPMGLRVELGGYVFSREKGG